MRRLGSYAAILISVWIAALTCARAADPGSQKWLQELWPQAETLGVLRAAEGFLPRGVPLCAQDARRGARQARRHAQLLGRRHGPDPVPALRILQIRG